MRFLAILLVFCFACDGGNSSNSNGIDPVGGDPAGGDTGYTPGDQGNGETRPANCTASWLTEVTGGVEDEFGNPIEGVYAQICIRTFPEGTLLCLIPQATDGSGRFVIPVVNNARCMQESTMRVFEPDGGYTTAYCHLDLPPVESTLDVADNIILHEVAPATTLPPKGDASVERTVIFGDGLELDVTPDTYFAAGGGYDALAARRFAPNTAGLCFVEDPSTLTAVYAVAPEGDVITDHAYPGFPMRIPNTEGLASGTTVDLYVLGGLGCTLADETLLEEGAWHAYGTGMVDSGGTTIVADPLPCLNWFGYGPQSP